MGALVVKDLKDFRSLEYSNISKRFGHTLEYRFIVIFLYVFWVSFYRSCSYISEHSEHSSKSLTNHVLLINL
jgi:hypothetical protein